MDERIDKRTDDMKQKIIAYSIALVIFTLLEILWLSQAAPHVYASLSPLMRPEPNIIGALLFFLGYPAGILYFAVFPNLGDFGKIMRSAALLGLLCYGTYSLTNLATLAGWTPTISLFDMGWGMTLTALTAGGTAILYGKIYAAAQK